MSGTTIDLLRHGEVEGGRCLGGHTDEPLSTYGWFQMRSVLSREPPPWEGIISSPLERCAAFAREVAKRWGLKLRLEPRFREIGLGSWEGRPWLELFERESSRLGEFWRNPVRNPAPGGEDYPDFERRVVEAWEEEWRDLGCSRHWLVVTHAGTIRVILRQVLDLPVTRLFEIEVPYACLSRVRRDGKGAPRLVFHGSSL
jgi:Fructose-2,6-bisphosphatase